MRHANANVSHALTDAPAGANHTGFSPDLRYNYSVSCLERTPLWINDSSAVTALNTSKLLPFPSGFTFPMNGTTFTRVAVNRYSGSIIFIPESATYNDYSREISTPTYASFVDDDVPLRWMKVSPSTGDKVRVICVWCDQYDLIVGNVTWQLASAPGSRVLRINIVGLKHTFLYPVGTLTAQVTLYETGAVKVQYVERSIANIGLGAVGLQFTTDTALGVPNSYLEFTSGVGCPGDAAIVYTPGEAPRQLLQRATQQQSNGNPGFCCSLSDGAATLSPCASINCGIFGVCLAGICMCFPETSYWGEYCDVAPPRKQYRDVHCNSRCSL